MLPRRAFSVLALVLGVSTGCPQREVDAKRTCEQFLTDIRTRRGAAAFAALSEASQAELRRRHRALAEAAGTDPEADPAYLIYRTLDVELMSTPESIAEASRPDAAEVLLRVAVKNGKSADIRMVREGTTWKVDLLGSLRPAAPEPTPPTPVESAGDEPEDGQTE